MWLALTFKVSANYVEALSDALMAAGALSVDVTDAHAGTPEEVALFAEPNWNADSHWTLAQVIVLLDQGSDAGELLRTACAEVGMGTPSFDIQTIADQDWVRQTQSQFTPVCVSDRLWIVPSWHDPPAPQAINLRLDPGLAFGTGSHATTLQCLLWLEANLRGGERVLDYGCGSGILAIAAMKLGAASAVGTDIDPQALRTAHDNASINEVSVIWVTPDELADSKGYDVVLANILANPLRTLAPLLCAKVRSGGHLVLAGILDRQAEEVIESFAPWIALTPFAPREGWTSLIGRRASLDALSTEPESVRPK